MRNLFRASVATFCLTACALCGTELDRGDLQFTYPSGAQLMTVKVRPMQWLDGAFYLSEGDPSMFLFAFHNPSKANPKDPHLMVALPNSLRVTAMQLGLKLERSTPWGAGRTLHDFKLPRSARGYASPETAASGRGVSVQVTTDARAGAKLPDMVCWFRDGERHGLRSALRLHVLPPIRAAMPKRFKVGPMLRKPTFYLRGKGADELGGFLKRCGLGWAIAGRNAPTTMSCMKAGLDVASEAGLANAYMLGWRMHPKDVAFRLATGDPVKRAVCPTAIYTHHPYIEQKLYTDTIHKLIARDRTCNHITTNWEPYMFLGKGCFCPRCREEFIRWSKLPADAIRKEWPLGVVKRRKAVWEKFFAWQHAQTLIALERMCQKAGREVGVDSHFFPQIACHLVDPAKKNDYYERMTDPDLYIQKAPWVQIWGGYVTWDIEKTRRRPIGARLGLDHYAGLARVWANKQAARGKRPYLSWGNGTALGTSTVTFPEGVTFDILCLYLNGIERTAGYVFPLGYDNRYWQAMARAAGTAARFEEFVYGGKRVARHEVRPATPTPKLDAGPTLRSFEFERDGRRLIAVGNFWEEGETFFHLKAKGLSPAARYVLAEPCEGRRLASPSGAPAWTGAELARGALLHAGKLRWAFFTIEPEAVAKAPKAVLTQQRIAAAMRRRKPAIRSDYATSMRVIRDMARAKTGSAGDYSKLKPLKLGGLACRVGDVNGDGKPEVTFLRMKEELVIEPAKGGRVLHWKLDGFDAAYRLGPMLSLAVDATWAPAHFIVGETRVLEHKVTPEGIVLKTERVIPKAARGCLPGIKVTRTLLVPRQPGAFRVTTKLTNTGRFVKEFAYRQASTPAFLTRTDKGEGWVRLWGEKGPFQFKRNFLKNAYHLAGQPRTKRLDTYAMDVSRTVTEPRVRLGCPATPVEIEARVEPGKLYKLVFWDSGGQAASTVEFVCKDLKLKPKQSWSVTVDWRRVK